MSRLFFLGWISGEDSKKKCHLSWVLKQEQVFSQRCAGEHVREFFVAGMFNVRSAGDEVGGHVVLAKVMKALKCRVNELDFT